jgi:hypothetical protein
MACAPAGFLGEGHYTILTILSISEKRSDSTKAEKTSTKDIEDHAVHLSLERDNVW